MSHPALFAADLHGDRFAYERLFSLAEERGVKTVILGGDLTPKWEVISFGPRGAIVPIHSRFLAPDENGKTFVDALEAIEKKTGSRRADAEKYYVGLGGAFRYSQTTRSWKELVGEQRILRALIAYVTGTGRRLEVEDVDHMVGMIRSVPADVLPDASRESLSIGLRYQALTEEQHREIGTFLRGVDTGIRNLSKEVQPLLSGYTSELDRMMQLDRQALAVLLQALLSANVIQKTYQDNGDLRRFIKPQQSFLQTYLNRRIRKYIETVPGGRVFFILGNDDSIECEETAQTLDRNGAATYVNKRAVEIAPGLMIAGYSHVPDSNGKFYGAWEKSEEELLDDLKRLETAATEASPGTRVIYVVHCPPVLTASDTGFEHSHYGSRSVRRWLEIGPPKHLLLCGHIHEAPFVNGGIWREKVCKTPVIQPGAWHDEGLCAALIDLEDPGQGEWIADLAKVRTV